MPAATRATATTAPTTGKVRAATALRRGRDTKACDVGPLPLTRASLRMNRGNLSANAPFEAENGEGSGMAGENSTSAATPLLATTPRSAPSLHGSPPHTPRRSGLSVRKKRKAERKVA